MVYCKDLRNFREVNGMNYFDWEEGCPLLLTQRIMLGKWKLSILWFLAEYNVMRYTELKAAFEDSALTQKMLTQHLKDLQNDGLVSRISYAQKTPKVEYSLTELGKTFIPVIRAMEDWGEYYISETKKIAEE